jgi:hypothetical protein
VIGERDAAATDMAELAALHQKAAQRRAELGGTVRALADQVTNGGLRVYARQAARRSAKAAWTATREAVVPSRPLRRPAAVAYAAAMGLAGCLLVAALTWRLKQARPTRQRPARARR